MTLLSDVGLDSPAEGWSPEWFTPRLHSVSDGDLVADFAQTFLVASKGMRAGCAMDLLPWQRWALRWALERKDNGFLRYRQAVIGVPRKAGKSLLGSAIALYYLVGNPDLGREIYSIAGDRQQAKLVFGEARWQVLNSPLLSRELKVFRDAIEHPATGSVYRVLSHDGKLAQGLNPFLTLADEAHVYPNSELWDAMTQGSGARPESLCLGITTAGDRKDSLLGYLFDYGRRIVSGESDDEAFGLAWWQAPDACDHLDELNWFRANPNFAAELADLDEMRTAARQTPEAVFRRYRLNQWVSLGGRGWMPMDVWGSRRSERRLVPGESIVLAFDGSVSRDATALVGMSLDGHIHVFGCWESDGRDDWQVPRDEVEAAITDVFDLYDVRSFQCDTAYWLAEFQRWQERFGARRVLDFTMSNARMVPAVQEFYAAVLDGTITHEGDARLDRHVGNAVTNETPRGVTIRKEDKDSPHKIDLAVAACMANDGRLRMPPPKRAKAFGF